MNQMMTVDRKVRILVYLIGIALLFMEIRFQSFSSAWKRMAIQKVREIAQHETRDWDNLWFGIPMQQFPSDLVLYQELIFKLKPEIIIETGTYCGGLSVYLATLAEQMSLAAKVITVDLDRKNWEDTERSGKIPESLRQRITFIQGDSASRQVVDQVRALASGKKAFVILDSYHARDHVAKELELYSGFVPKGGYMIVNDTHLELIGGIRIDLIGRLLGKPGIGPWTAVMEFLKANKDFELDATLPRSHLSCAPSGFLRRI